MKPWTKQAVSILKNTLQARLEKNELDWKSSLSSKNDLLSAHLSAFANYEGGGFLVFGISDQAEITGISESEARDIIFKLTNLGIDGLEPKISIEHEVIKYESKNILIIFIQESDIKPIHLRGKDLNHSYIRSGASTRIASEQEVKDMIKKSAREDFETLTSLTKLTKEEIAKLLDIQIFYELLKLPFPSTIDLIIADFIKFNFLKKQSDIYSITNLGAILLGKDLNNFPEVSRKRVRVIVYDGNSRTQTIKEQIDGRGYASGFEGFITYIKSQLPTKEIIASGMRNEIHMYPELVIRELVANALIHQDFYIRGTGPMIEIFKDRVEISNPGRPKIRAIEFSGRVSVSRNEILADMMRKMHICEERGSGIDKVLSEIEKNDLPPPEFVEDEHHVRVTLYSKTELSKMDRKDKVRACYQHACLKFLNNEKMTNQSLRERFHISEGNAAMVSRIITDAMEDSLIKPSDPSSSSRKFKNYLPFWA